MRASQHRSCNLGVIMENDAAGQPHKKTRMQIDSDQSPTPDGRGDACADHNSELEESGDEMQEESPVTALDVVDPTSELTNGGHGLVAAVDGLTTSP